MKFLNSVVTNITGRRGGDQPWNVSITTLLNECGGQSKALLKEGDEDRFCNESQRVISLVRWIGRRARRRSSLLRRVATLTCELDPRDGPVQGVLHQQQGLHRTPKREGVRTFQAPLRSSWRKLIIINHNPSTVWRKCSVPSSKEGQQQVTVSAYLRRHFYSTQQQVILPYQTSSNSDQQPQQGNHHQQTPTRSNNNTLIVFSRGT
jgi:hypothetical protein